MERHRQTEREKVDLMTLIPSFQNKRSRLKALRFRDGDATWRVIVKFSRLFMWVVWWTEWHCNMFLP
jgi:hypothetical protein